MRLNPKSKGYVVLKRTERSGTSLQWRSAAPLMETKSVKCSLRSLQDSFTQNKLEQQVQQHNVELNQNKSGSLA